MPVKDYSTNPDDNLTINGINIAEGMPPGLVNNAIRQLMSDVKINAVETDASVKKAYDKAATVFPKDGIIMWSGAVKDIPEGWALCDGTNGTPNLTDRFILGAGKSYQPGATGGATTHGHGVTVQGTTLVDAHLPATRRNVVWPNLLRLDINKGTAGSYYLESSGTTGANNTPITDPLGSSAAHFHGATASTASNMPPYYALCLIMKL